MICFRSKLAPGETRTLHLAVPASDHGYYDEDAGWEVVAGEYEVIAGRNALDEPALRTNAVIEEAV